jgi:hypothetical protein
VKRSFGLIALLGSAILAIIAVVGLTHPIQVEPGSANEATSAAPAPRDAGSLDSLLDAVRIEHGFKHGR